MMRRVLLILGCAVLSSSAAQGQLDRHRMEQVVDSIIGSYLVAEDYLTGGVVALVYPDGSNYLKGYGLADIAGRRPFDPKETVVEVASVSKLITTTAFLSLWEEGLVSLKDTVERLLPGVDLNYDPARPVLVEHLLTHTSGLDDRMTYMESSTKEGMVPLQEFDRKYLPAVVWEPGRFFNYSNYGLNLLAEVVQQVSRRAFADVVRDRLLIPLDMDRSGIGYPPDLMPDLMHRYHLKADDNDSIFTEDQGVKWTNTPGANGFKTTAGDMARFIRMYLDSGRYQGQRILRQETVVDAWRTHFSPDTGLYYQQGLGWRILQKHGKRIVFHDGDDRGTESSLVLFPDKGFGYFTAFNDQVGVSAKRAIRDALWELVHTDQVVRPKQFVHTSGLDRFTGVYLYMNDGQASFEKLTALLGDVRLEVVQLNDSTLGIDDRRYRALAPLLFEELEINSRVRFLEDDGRVTHLTFGSSTYRKVPAWKDPQWHQLALAASILIIIAAFLGWTLMGLTRIIRGRVRRPAWSHRAWIMADGTAILLFVVFLFITSRTTMLGKEVPTMLVAALTASLLAAVLFPLNLWAYSKLVRAEDVKKLVKWGYGLLVLAITIVLAILAAYHLIGYDFV